MEARPVRETFEMIAVKVCQEYEKQHPSGALQWNTASGSETQKIWLVIDAIIKELDRRELDK
jgi:hypothetical protein